MKNILKVTFLFVMLYTLEVRAQNYSPIVNGNTSLFNFLEQIEALHVDSITTDQKGDAHHFIKTWEDEYSTECHAYDFPAWTGAKCVISSNTYYFFNQDLDTIILKPTKEVNGSWKFYSYANNQYIEAEVTNKTLESFLNLTDSVKTIRLQLKDTDGSPLSSSVNGTELQISKNYGLTKFINVLHFPSYVYVGNLAGMTIPQTGLQLLSAKDIYNYEIGDEFHYEEVYSNPPDGTGTFAKKIQRVLEVRLSLNTDTVIYKMQRSREINSIDFSTNVQSTIYDVDTFFEIHILNQPVFYPNQAIPIADVNVFINQHRYSSYLYEKSTNYSYNDRFVMLPTEYPTFVEEEECWRSLIDYPEYIYVYASGIGLTFREYQNYFGPQQDYTHLVYFKKGTEAWGEPLVLSTYSKASNAQLSLFPNPLKQDEQLHFAATNFIPVQITITSALGKVAFASALETQNEINSVDLSHIPTGLYVVQLVNRSNQFVTGRLLIK